MIPNTSCNPFHLDPTGTSDSQVTSRPARLFHLPFLDHKEQTRDRTEHHSGHS